MKLLSHENSSQWDRHSESDESATHSYSLPNGIPIDMFISTDKLRQSSIAKYILNVFKTLETGFKNRY